MCSFTRPLLAASATTALALAQSVALSAPTASTVTAMYAGNQQTVNLPVGPMTLQGSLSASAGSASVSAYAELLWSAAATPYSVDVFLTAAALVPAPGPGLAASGPAEVLITLSYPTLIFATLELSKSVSGSAGASFPITRVDVFDDGNLELSEMFPDPQVVLSAPVGPAGLVIRCTLDATTAVVGNLAAGLRVRMLPGDTLVNPLFNGCGAPGYSVSPRFDGNLEFGVNNTQFGAAFAVFGLATQPLLLGSQPWYPGGPLAPCLLMPQPDLVVFLPQPQPQILTIPPAARPIVLYTQGVLFGGPVLATSVAFQIDAY